MLGAESLDSWLPSEFWDRAVGSEHLSSLLILVGSVMFQPGRVVLGAQVPGFPHSLGSGGEQWDLVA